MVIYHDNYHIVIYFVGNNRDRQYIKFHITHHLLVCMNMLLYALDKPLPPTDLTSVSLGSNSALVSWSRPSHDGSSTITNYLLEHKRGDQVIPLNIL